jgi:DNA-damage-inducible protein J
MTKTSVLNARIEPDLKKNTEEIFKKLGLTSTQAITLFYRQVVLNQGLPFDVSLPNPTTIKALHQAYTRRTLKSFQNAEDLFKDLNIK